LVHVVGVVHFCVTVRCVGVAVCRYCFVGLGRTVVICRSTGCVHGRVCRYLFCVRTRCVRVSGNRMVTVCVSNCGVVVVVICNSSSTVRIVAGFSNRILGKTYGQTHGSRENQRVGQEFNIAGKNKHTSCFILLNYRAAVAVVSAAGAAAPPPFCSARNWNTYLMIFQRSS